MDQDRPCRELLPKPRHYQGHESPVNPRTRCLPYHDCINSEASVKSRLPGKLRIRLRIFAPPTWRTVHKCGAVMRLVKLRISRTLDYILCGSYLVLDQDIHVPIIPITSRCVAVLQGFNNA